MPLPMIDVVIVNGIGYDDFMEKLLAASTKPDRIVINVDVEEQSTGEFSIAGALFDFGLYFFHNAKAQIAAKTGTPTRSPLTCSCLTALISSLIGLSLSR